jgi:CheY-like chemotaxis protein
MLNRTEDMNTASGITILIAEDSDDVRFILKYHLTMSNHNVIEATDGYEALELAKQHHPDLILMDLNLPQLNGLATTRSIRQDKDLCRTPIVIISAYDLEYHGAIAIAAGCNEFLKKPIEFDKLDETINRFNSNNHNTTYAV